MVFDLSFGVCGWSRLSGCMGWETEAGKGRQERLTKAVCLASAEPAVGGRCTV